MAFPKITLPIFELKLPSTDEFVKYRPFTVKEEKMLLVAQESENDRDRLNSIRQIVNNCIISETIKDVNSLPSFDLMYCYIKIAAKSISNEVSLSFRDQDDNKVYNFIVDLDKLEITRDPNHTNMLEFESGVGVIMRYPTVEIINSVVGTENETEELLYRCIETIYDSENTYSVADGTREELIEFVESIPRKDFEKVIEFFETMPELKHDLHYKDSNGTAKTITLRDMDDFFPQL